MAKFCSNGHQMEDSWEICPYCQRTGFAGLTNPSAQPRPAWKGSPIPAALPAAACPRARRARPCCSPSRKRAPVVGWFVAMNGEQKGEDFRIRDGQNILGSGADADIVIRDGTVSSRHASLRYKDQRFYLTDLDSSNGTYLNESQRVARPRRTARQ